MTPLPTLAIALGLLGLVPFAACGLLAVSADPAFAPRALLALLAYGAVILAFLGGVHWGFALEGGPQQAPFVLRSRLILGVLPSLIGWSGLILAILGLSDLALVLLIVGFIGLMIFEAQAHRRGLMPRGYIWLRWALSVGVIVTLVSVTLLRVFGGSIEL